MNPQTLNRYSYCGNNPINHIDPDGHAFWFIPFIVAAIKGAVVGALTGGAIAAVTGGNIGQGFLTGAIGGAIFGVTGSIIKDWGMLGKALAHTAAGALSGGLGAEVTGGDFGRGALIGGVSAGVAKFAGEKINFFGGGSSSKYVKFGSDFVKQTLIGAAVGGTVSKATGGSFNDGAKLGAISAGIGFVANKSLHEGLVGDFIDKTLAAFGELSSQVIEAIFTSDFGKAAGQRASVVMSTIQTVFDVNKTVNDSTLKGFEKGIIGALQVVASGSTLVIGGIGATYGAAFGRLGGSEYGTAGALIVGTISGATVAVFWKDFVIGPLRDHYRKD